MGNLVSYQLSDAAGPYKITANEVAIGLTMPRPAIGLGRQRLTPAHFNRAMILAEVHAPDEAVAAGFLDRAMPAAGFGAAARAVAEQLGRLDRDAYAASKQRTRRQALDAFRQAIQDDAGDLAGALAGA
jgi:enoyl-CoA hydratase